MFLFTRKRRKNRKITCKSFSHSFSCKPSLGEVWKKKFKGYYRSTRSAIHFRLSKTSPEAVLFHYEDTGTAYLKLKNKTTYVPLFQDDKPQDGLSLLQKIHRSRQK